MKGEDSVVQVSTDLPPQVDGQLRCFCKLNIPKIVWTIPKVPAATFVRVKWWGEDGQGTVFRPLDVRKGKDPESRTIARYPVRSGPMQFATYLKDMNSLVLDVMDNPKSRPMGHATVSGLSQLSTTKGIKRKLPVMSNSGQKLADLDVSLVLEHLMASYDCNGSIPTSDVNTGQAQGCNRPQSARSHYPNDSSKVNSGKDYDSCNKLLDQSKRNDDAVAITANGDVVSLPIHGHGVQRVSAGANIGLGPDHLHSNNLGPAGGKDLLSMLVDRGKMLRDAMAVSAMHTDKDPKHSNALDELSLDPSLVNSPAGIDTSLMTNSVSPSPQRAISMLMETSPIKKQDLQLYRFVTDGSPGTSLSSDFGLDHVMSELEDPNHEQSILQDLFYNDSDNDAFNAMNGMIPSNLLPVNLPGMSHLLAGYPLIPSAINVASIPPSSMAVDDPGNQRPPSRASSMTSLNMDDDNDSKVEVGKKKKVKRKARSRSRSKSTSRSRSRSVTPSRPSEMKSKKERGKENLSLTSKDGSVTNLHRPKKKVKSRSRARERLLGGKKKIDAEGGADAPSTGVSDASFVSESLSQRSDVDGLSVERLTLLGRVHFARVNLEILNLNKSNVWDLSSFFSDHLKSGKVKRALKVKKPCAFFVEYQFPVVDASKDKYTPTAIATEVTRVASRNIKNGAVSFGHRSVYPIMFDGSALERWWKSALVFRLFAREAGQNSPSLIGSGGISLKSILKSDNLFVKRDVEIPDANHDGLLNSSRSSINTTLNSRSGVTIFGHLTISVELASDHKEFATVMARTKLSEMSGSAKIVPLGSAKRDKAQLVKQLNKNRDVPIVKSPVKKIDLPLAQSDQLSRNNNSSSGVVGLPPQSPRRKGVDTSQCVTSQAQAEEEDEIGKLKKQLKGLIGNMAVSVNDNSPELSSPHVEATTLQLLLYIEDGRNFSISGVPPLHMANQQPVLLQRQINGNKTVTRNSYLACRMFWCNDVIHSQVCWNSLNPDYNFLQVSSVTLNSSLMERMKDNYMIVEVWDKQAGTTNDKLIGLVKLSLHQFYLSFRDRKIGNALLKSQYPVIAIDNYMPVIDLFSGLYFGQLKVVLALGSQHQISSLQQTVVSGMQCNGQTSRSHQGRDGSDPMAVLPIQGQVDHHFEIVVEGVRGLKVFEKMIWGEADCFVQFFFPSQGDARADNGGVVDMKALTRMKCFRTATTLCIPDPVFHDSTQVKLTLPVGKPVQPELLIACSNPGEQGKGLPFEVWCRYYHPNVRDQRIAQGMLPIAKLCAMVTMHRPSLPCVQSFTVHLSQVTASDTKQDGAETKNTGLMDVAIRYSSQTAQGEENVSARSRNLPTSQTCLIVEIIRASGLKAAAECAAQSDSSMAFCADVGVNPYIRVRLPFPGKESERITKTIARCFTPEFSQSMDFPCSLSLSNNASSSRTTSLAELLEGTDAVFEVWHQTSGQSYSDMRMEEETYMNGPIHSQGDVLLGMCNVPLLSLLTHTTGIHGWFPITQPQLSWTKPSKEEQHGPKNQILGGLELSLRFADLNDRDRVVSVGRDLGWSPLHMESGVSGQREGGDGHVIHKMTINVEVASFPKSSAVKAGLSNLESSSLCYVCYKLYDQGLTVSKSRKIHVNESTTLQSCISHKQEFALSHSPDLKRYLQEKRLEIQVFVTYSDGKKDERRPRQGDRLVGSCYIDLDSLLDTRMKEQQISGSFPLFNGNSPSMKSAFVRANIVSTVRHSSSHNRMSDFDGSVMETDEGSDSDSTLTLDGDIQVEKSPKNKKKGKCGDIEASFSVVLALERAMHLPMVSERNRSSEVRPSTYVSYQSAERSKPSHTTIFPNSCNPLWDYAVETRLSKEHLYKQNKNLVLKVWHKPSDASKSPDKSSDRVLGFVSVDLSPLSKGLNQLCGWYNIIDFTGQCRGQIKVSITPQEMAASNMTSDPNISGFGLTSLPTPGLSLTNTQTTTSTIANQLQQLQQHVMARMGSLSRNLAVDETTSTNAVSVNNYQNLDTSEELMTTGSLSTNHPTPRHQHQRLFYNTSLSQPDSARDESSKSLLFSTLRRQMADLDKVMEGFKDRVGTAPVTTGSLSNHFMQPADNEKSGEIIYGSQSELSTIHTASSLMNTRESSAPSKINNSSTDVVTSQEMHQENNKGNDRQENIKIVSKDPKGKLSDSGVFCAKNCSEGVKKSAEENMENGQADKHLLLTLSDNQSTLHSVFDGNLPVLEEVIPVSADTSEKTQPFVLNGSNSESSQNSHGFPLRRSKNHLISGSPSKSDSTAKSSSLMKNGGLVNEGSHSSGSKTQLEVLADEVSDDESDSEEEKKFGSYRRYRDLLDAEEEEEDDVSHDEEEGDRVEIIPRNLNLSPVLPDSATPLEFGSPVINSRHQDFNMNTVANGESDACIQSPLEVSPSRNVHEGTSVWYSEEEDREGGDRFQEVFERNQRLLKERGGEDSDDVDDVGEWMLMEKEVLANQNVEEWLVHRSHDKDNEWLGYDDHEQREISGRGNTPRNVVGERRDLATPCDDASDRIDTNKPCDIYTPRNAGGVDESNEKAFDEGKEKMKPRQGSREEMKLMLDDDDESDEEYDEKERKDLFYSSDEDQDTVRNEDGPLPKSGTDIDEFLNTEQGDEVEVSNGLQNLRIQGDEADVISHHSEASHSDREMSNQPFSNDATVVQPFQQQETDHQFSTDLTNGLSSLPPTQTGEGARPKIRHLLSNVELNSETSNSGSRRNSKGSAASVASQNGVNYQFLDHHGESLDVVESEFTRSNGRHDENGFPSELLDRDSEFCMRTIDNNLGNSLPESNDVIEEVIECNEEENDEKIYARERKRERKGINDRNSTMDSAFVDGECSDGHATTVNSSGVTGGHMSYVEDSGLEPSAEMNGVGGHMTSGGNGSTEIPNFFMNTEELQGSLAALQMATAAANNVTQRDAKGQNKVKAMSDLVQKIADSKMRSKPALAKAKPPPSTDQTKRIAKIFSSKPS